MKKFLIVDDHSIIRHGVGTLICNRYKGSTYMEASDGDECVGLARSNSFDLIILDVNLPDTDTIELTDWLIQRTPGNKVLMFSMYPTNQYAGQYYKKGAVGYINKQADSKEILRAVDHIMNNGIYIPEELQDVASTYITDKASQTGFDQLSEQEFAVAQHIVKGLSHEEIANMLSIEASTVRTFKTRIFKKLEVKTLYEFLRLYQHEFNRK